MAVTVFYIGAFLLGFLVSGGKWLSLAAHLVASASRCLRSTVSSSSIVPDKTKMRMRKEHVVNCTRLFAFSISPDVFLPTWIYCATNPMRKTVPCVLRKAHVIRDRGSDGCDGDTVTWCQLLVSDVGRDRNTDPLGRPGHLSIRTGSPRHGPRQR